MCSVVRILLCDADPAVEELLRAHGHEPVVLDPRISIERQVAGVDALLFDPGSPGGRRAAAAARAMRKPCRRVASHDTLGVSWEKLRTANQEFNV